MSFEQKYLKYKTKYLNLKNQIGGQLKEDELFAIKNIIKNYVTPLINHDIKYINTYNLDDFVNIFHVHLMETELKMANKTKFSIVNSKVIDNYVFLILSIPMENTYLYVRKKNNDETIEFKEKIETIETIESKNKIEQKPKSRYRIIDSIKEKKYTELNYFSFETVNNGGHWQYYVIR